MRIVCPACAAAYQVPETLRGATRPVRCARCGHEWPPEEAEDEAVAPPAAATPAAAPARVADEPLAMPAAAGTLAPHAIFRPSADAAPLVAPPVTPVAAPPKPVSPLFAPAATAATAATADLPRDPEAAERRETTVARAAWAGSVLVLILLAWGAYTWRDNVMRAWPPSQRVYAVLGLT